MKARYAREQDGTGRDQAVAKDEYHDKHDKGNQVNGQKRRKQQLVCQ